jgi:DNA-binding MarR family transcriptional regulator
VRTDHETVVDPLLADLAEELMVSLRAINRKMRQSCVADMLSQPERIALARIDRLGPLTAAELARLEGVRPQSMTPVLGALADRGLITRIPDAADGRCLMIAATDAGRERIAAIRRGHAQRIAEALDVGFSEEEVLRLAAAGRLLDRLARSL